MRLRTLFRLFLLLAAVAPITTAKADSLIIGTDTLRLDLHWLDDTPLDELARNDRVFEKKFQALIHQPTAEGFVIYIDGDHEHHSYWRLIDDKLYLDHTIRKSDYSEIDFSGIFVRDHTGYYPATFYSGTLPISGIFYQDGTKPIFVFEEGRLTYTNWTYPSFPCPLRCWAIRCFCTSTTCNSHNSRTGCGPVGCVSSRIHPETPLPYSP